MSIHPGKGKYGRRLMVGAILIASAVLLMTGCSSTTKRKWLTLFFDGVPAENQAGSPAVTSAANGNTTNAPANEIGKRAPQPPPQENFPHPPFKEQNCAACHQSQFGQQMKKFPDACFVCHQDFLAGKKVRHQPVMDGDCKSCHSPHEADNKKLLIKKGSDLCLTCHDNPLDAGKFKHQAVEVGNCLDCHAPHATDFKGLLKKSVKETCADCHEDLAKKKVVHPPVSDGDCLACHVAHASNKKHLVKKTAPALCWDCHDNFLEKAKFRHDVVDDCTSCHNPHQSAEKGLLAKNILKLCGDCHDDKDLKAVKGHAGAEGKSCTSCHDPHVGKNAKLLKPSAVPK